MQFIEKYFFEGKNYSKQQKRLKYATISSVVGVVANIFLSIFKMICGLLFSSISVLGDGINNLSDCATSAITFVGFKLSEKPADKEHPFGHARVEYVSGFVVSFVILFIGFQLFLTSFDKIFNPDTIKTNLLTTIILICSMIIKFFLYLFNNNIGKHINSTAIIGVAKDSFNDIFITLGVLISSGIYHYLNINIDGYVGVIISILVAKCGYDLAKDTLSPIIGEAPNQEFIKDIYESIMKKDKVLGVHDLIVHTYGEDKYFASVHVEFDAKIEFIICHEIADEIEREFEEKGIQIVVHCDPVMTDSKEFDMYKNIVKTQLNKIDKQLSIHGFRYINQDTHVKLLFDVVSHNNMKISKTELINTISTAIQDIDEKFICIIRVDENYNNIE